MARNVYGLDLGSYDIKVYDKKKDTIWKEKNVIAFKDNRDRDIFAVGDDAFSMYGKAPSNIEITFPMKEGVISRFNPTASAIERSTIFTSFALAVEWITRSKNAFFSTSVTSVGTAITYSEPRENCLPLFNKF